MKNQRIRDIVTALNMLANRTLPSPSAVTKVHFLLADRFVKPYEATEAGRKKIIADIPTPPEWEAAHLPPMVAEKRQAEVDLLMQKDTPVRKIPDHMRLKAADMPKVLKGEDGYKNAEGLASIQIALGPLYVREGDEIVKDQPDGFESDDAEAPVADPMAEHTA